MEPDIRWEQRFSNYIKALDKLKQSVDYIQQNVINENESVDEEELGSILNEMLKEGLIQRFEYTHELA